jgi:predicted  nucleic acid-binding Zn-ribbon protein
MNKSRVRSINRAEKMEPVKSMSEIMIKKEQSPINDSLIERIKQLESTVESLTIEVTNLVDYQKYLVDKFNRLSTEFSDLKNNDEKNQDNKKYQE